MQSDPMVSLTGVTVGFFGLGLIKHTGLAQIYWTKQDILEVSRFKLVHKMIDGKFPRPITAGGVFILDLVGGN